MNTDLFWIEGRVPVVHHMDRPLQARRSGPRFPGTRPSSLGLGDSQRALVYHQVLDGLAWFSLDNFEVGLKPYQTALVLQYVAIAFCHQTVVSFGEGNKNQPRCREAIPVAAPALAAWWE